MVLAGVLLVAGCGESRTTTAPPATADATGAPYAAPSTTTSTPPARAAAGIEVTTGPSDFGTMLFDARGQAIYLFDKERTSVPECYGDCASAWPPVLTDGSPQASGKARQALLGTTTREDGSTQVTYAGQPLYYYAHEGPGQVLCHDVREYGGLWLVVTPSGVPAD